MILTDNDIIKEVNAGRINITGFDPKNLGSNSYDLTLGDTLLIYKEKILDPKKDNKHEYHTIPADGMVLLPGELYLGSTVESTDTRRHVPLLEGKSSLARLGISVHVTAGFGDIGFKGHWTLEITVVKPVLIYPGLPVAQIYFVVPLGQCNNPYSRKVSAKYQSQGAKPTPSLMWKNYVKEPA